MADNTELNAGSGGDTVGMDDIGGVKYQRVKIIVGADGTNDGDVASGNPMPVSGTVTANLGATDNAVLDAIQAAVEVIDNAISGSEMQVDVVSSALPTGAATAAKQPALGTAGSSSSDVLSVQGIASGTALPVSGTVTANLGATDNAVLDAIQAAVEVIDNAIAGNEMQVDVVAALPAGTNNIGDVDVLSVVPGTGATNLGKAEDAAHSSGDVGVMALGVRQSSQSSFGADGDYSPVSIDDNGGVRVSIVAGAGSGGTAAADDADFTAGTTQGTPAMGVYESSPSSVTDGDLGTVGITQTRALRTAVEGTVTVTGDSGGSLTVDGTVTANLSATDNAVLDAIQAAVEVIDNAIAGSEMQVDVVTSALPTGAATAANQSTANTALQLIDNPVVAHDAAISGATGTYVIGLNARSAEPTAVASADATQMLATLLGKPVVQPYAIPASTWSYASPSAVTDTSDDVAKAAAGAGIRNYITSLQVINGHDTVGTAVVIKDGSTVIWQGWCEQTGGGVSAKFDPPLRGTANTAVNVANITTGSSTFFNLQGFVAAE